MYCCCFPLKSAVLSCRKQFELLVDQFDLLRPPFKRYYGWHMIAFIGLLRHGPMSYHQGLSVARMHISFLFVSTLRIVQVAYSYLSSASLMDLNSMHALISSLHKCKGYPKHISGAFSLHTFLLSGALPCTHCLSTLWFLYPQLGKSLKFYLGSFLCL